MFTEKDFEKIYEELPEMLDNVSIPQELFKYLPEELIKNCTSGRDFIIKEIKENEALKVLNRIDPAYLWVLILYKIVLHAQQIEKAFIDYPSRHDMKMVDLLEVFNNLKEKEEKFWAEAEVGKKYQGTVKSLTSFGAFVDIGGVDGLVHISELSWNKIKHPSEVVKEGDVLDVYIKDLNRETKKISLGFKKIEDNPWTIAQSKINVGDVVKCKIVRMMPFGAFAEIMPNVDGLIHISQIADRRIGKPEDVLTIGEEVEAKVTDLNWDEKKISLSIRALIPTPEKEEEVKEEEAPVEDHNAETLVYSTDPEVEVEEAIEVEADDAE